MPRSNIANRLVGVVSVAAILAGSLEAQETSTTRKDWIQLFNGKDLKNWTVKIKGYEAGENFGNTFRVEDGILKVGYEKYDDFDRRFGHIFYKGTFSNYRLRAEYRFVGDQVKGGPGWALRNSGLMLHGQSPESMLKDQDFPVSIEVQLLGGDGKAKRTTANLCTPGTNVVMNGKLFKPHCTGSNSKTYHGEQWVTCEVEVVGNKITHIVNGTPVLQYTDPQLDPRDADAKRLLAAGARKMLTGGTISLQSESHPVEFRKVELLPLDPPKSSAGAPKVGTEWVDLLASGGFEKNWETKGNWKIDSSGVVSLEPRAGERGWSRFDAYLWLKGDYKDFEFAFDYRVEPRSNSGFYFHVGDRKSPVAKGIEVQIYDSHRKGNKNLNDHDSGGIIPGIPPTKNAAKAPGEWNHFEISCRGTSLTVKLNGVVVNEVQLDQGRLKGRPASGAIGFQDHALPLALRNLKIRRL